ncbi:MAG TPA: FUN14 domain-containing protein [Nitrospira sp.]|nr:FUN14 domain-containing protein [Nitrospira sp.]
MVEEEVCSPAPTAPSGWNAILADPPWAAKSFLAVALGTVGGLASWIGNYTSPAMAQIGASYLGGFLIGWAFRRFLRMAAMLVAAVLACIAVMKATGWIDVDWSLLEAQVGRTIQWLHGEAEGLKNLMTGFLPSAGAAGAGSFFGFRKK